MYSGRVGGYLGALEVLQVRLKHSVRTPGSTVMWMPWGLTAQRCRKSGFIDLTAHGIVRHFLTKFCFRDAHLSNVLRFRLTDTQRPELPKL